MNGIMVQDESIGFVQGTHFDREVIVLCVRSYSPELEPDIVLPSQASGVDETCTPFGDRRRWQRYKKATFQH
jgi:hypothetical protein